MQHKPLVAVALALAAILAAPSDAHAQSCASNGRCNITPSTPSATLRVQGITGYKTGVSISILGGAASYAHQLYYFVDPFDPKNGKFSPNKGAKIAVGPAKPRNTSNWVAAANSTNLGLFDHGQELVLGILVNGREWFYSGSPSRNSGNKTMLNHFGSSPVYADNRTTAIAGTQAGRDVYGFEDIGGNYGTSDRDFNDFVFAVNQSTVTPEPASMILLGTGLAGVAGAVRRRRKRDQV